MKAGVPEAGLAWEGNYSKESFFFLNQPCQSDEAAKSNYSLVKIMTIGIIKIITMVIIVIIMK